MIDWLRRRPLMFALDPPPLITLKPRLIVCRMSTALLMIDASGATSYK